MQPFHLSDEAAAKTHFGRIAASGWHTCAMTMAMIAKNVVETEQAGLGSPGVDELRWLKPVYPGDTLRIESEIVDVRPSRSKRSEEHTSELQSLMRISYAVFCLKKKQTNPKIQPYNLT